MTAKTDLEPKSPLPEPDFSKFADRDFMEGVEIDENQEWIREELERRVQRIESGEAKFYTLEEVRQWLDEYKREYRRKQP